jgi:general nucleoside transport system permease protein
VAQIDHAAAAADLRPSAESIPPVEWLARRSEGVVIPVAAVLLGLVLFGIFILALGKSPVQLYSLMYKGGFGTWFSIQNSLQRASPLLLAGLCVALPARLGLVIIGGEGAIVLGGLAAAAVAPPLTFASAFIVLPLMAIAAILAGGIWIGAVGALRQYRGVNETISSLLMAYIAIALMNQMVEGPLRDPASLNKPSTAPIDAAFRVGNMPGMDVHWGFAAGVIGCIFAWILIEKTTWGFSARIAGGNIRAALLQGLPVQRLVIGFTALGGAFAGLAGMFEVAAIQGNANASLAAGYGYTGILIAFLARQNPLAIIPFAILLGGVEASNGLIQRRMGLPDATVLVLEGLLFVVVLLSETVYGRLRIFQPELWSANKGVLR